MSSEGKLHQQMSGAGRIDAGLLKAVVDTAVDGIITIDPKGTIITANLAVERIFGYAPHELIGENVRSLMPAPYHSEHDGYLKNYATTGDRKIIGIGREVKGLRKDGSEFPLELAVAETPTDQGPIFTGIVRDITERKRSEEDLRRERALLKAVVETAVDGILTIDPMGTILTANPAAERIFGYSSDELVGQNVRVLMPSPYHEEHDSYLKNYRDGGERKIIGIGREVKGLRKDGTVFPLELAVAETPTEEGPIFTGIVRDISDRKRSEEAHNRLAAIVESSEDAIISKSLDGIVTTWNNGAVRMFGYEAGEIVGKHISMLIPDDRLDEENMMIRRLMSAEKVDHYETVRRRKDGSYIDVSLTISKIKNAEGEIIGASKIARDITERKHTEEMMVAKESAERANTAKNEFLSRMSHELRTPLNGVLGYAQLLEMRNSDPSVKEATHAIIRAGQHLLNLINEILDLSRIEAGAVTVSLEPVSIREVVSQAVDLLRPISAKSNIPLLVDEGSLRGDYVVADRRRLLQVFINVISNAIKYNRPNGQVRIWGMEFGDSRFRVYVADNGEGISHKDQDSLFQPFMRFGDLSVEGSGLGLVLSKNFLDLMGGTLSLLESGPGGSTFTVELNVTDPTLDKSLWTPSGSESMKPDIPGEHRVVYIEDNMSNFRLMELAFSDWGGVKLIPAIQGQVGIEIVRQILPHLVLLDLHLPDMSGLEVLKMLKRDPRTTKIPVIVISADATPGQIKALKAAGAFDYVTKPVDLRRIASVVEAALTKMN